MRTRKAVVTAAVSAALLAAGLGAGSIASAAIGSSTGQDTKSDQGAQEAQSAPREATKFPENESGQTYGSAAEVTEEYLPDLVLVMTNEGGEGYVPRDEIFPPAAKSLEEALATTPRTDTIDVYATDGKTVVGTFTFREGSSSGEK